MAQGSVRRIGAALTLALAGLLVGAPPAAAQAVDQATRQAFEAQDTDGNGRLSKSEFRTRYTDRYRRADANRDGRMTADELVALYRRISRTGTLGPRAERRYRARHRHQDENEDGLVTAEEHLAFADSVFAYFDRNHDGVVTLAEFEAAGRR